MPNKLFGEVLSEGILSVKARQGRKISDIEEDIAEALGYAPATVQSWKKGSVPIDETQVEFLAQYVVQNGKRGRQWLNRFLTQARYYDRQRLLDELCPEQAALAAGAKTVYHNLPSRSGEFLGREQEMAQVIEGLASRWPLISIEGMGGIGKTTLATEVGCTCLPGGPADLDDPFEACVFISAKDRPITLNDLLDAIARVLNYPYIIQQTPPAEKPAEVDRLLRSYRVLIIADNFETVTDPALIAYLQNIPEPSKALITTRHGRLRTVWPVSLKGLPETEALELIRRHARRLRLPAVAGAADELLKPLVIVTDGNPKAIEMALGYLKRGMLSLGEVVDHLHHASKTVGDIFDYLFARAWEVLSQDAHHVLMVMPFFVESASKEALGAAAGLGDYHLDVALGQLVEMSLLDINGELEEAQQRYSVHPLTVAFAGTKLGEAPEWERETRERWSDFFVQYVELYGDEDLGEEIGDREKLKNEIKNLRLAIEWCFEHRPEKAVRLVERITTFLLDEGEWPERLELCRRALEVAQTSACQAGLQTRLGWSYLVQGDYQQAQEAQDEGRRITQEHGDYKRLVQLLRDSGWLHSKRGEHFQAYQLCTESLELASNIGDELGILLAKAFRARVAYMKGDYQEAKQDFRKLLPEFQSAHHPRDIDFVLRLLGNIAISEGRFDKARDYLQAASESIFKSYYEAHEEVQLDQSWGDLEKATGHLDKSLEAYKKALDLATRLGMRKEIEQLEALIQETEDLLANNSPDR